MANDCGYCGALDDDPHREGCKYYRPEEEAERRASEQESRAVDAELELAEAKKSLGVFKACSEIYFGLWTAEVKRRNQLWFAVATLAVVAAYLAFRLVTR